MSGLAGALLARLDAQAEGDVVEHRHVAEQRVVLEDEAHLALAHMGLRGVLAIKQHAAAVSGLQPGNDAQQRGLAAARGVQRGDEFARGEVEADVAERGEAAEGLADVLDLDAHDALGGAPSTRRIA